jgi:hypothetical protein
MPRHEIATKKVVYEIAGAEAVPIRRDVPYRDTGTDTLVMDVYSPPGATAAGRLPAVVFAIGYSDHGALARLGCRFCEMESFVGWARLVALSGAVAITYGSGTDPAADFAAVMQHVGSDAAALGVDANRIGVWACSGHAPTALSALLDDAAVHPACAMLYYPYTLDDDGSTGVAGAAAAFGFATPAHGRRVDDLARDVPLFIARAGLDAMPQLNVALDRFAAASLARNLPLTLANHATGPHAFDLVDDTEASRAIIRQTLAFLRAHLRL